MARGNLPAQTPQIDSGSFFAVDFLYRYLTQLNLDLANLEGTTLPASLSRTGGGLTLQPGMTRDVIAGRVYRFDLSLAFSAAATCKLNTPGTATACSIVTETRTSAGVVNTFSASPVTANIVLANPGFVRIWGIYHADASGTISLSWNPATTASLLAGSNFTCYAV